MEIIGYEIWALHGETDARGRAVRTLSMKADANGLPDIQSEYERLEANNYKPRVYELVKDTVDITNRLRLEASK